MTMFPAKFEYSCARSLEEALAQLGRYGGDARVLAGGQSLIPDMRARLSQPGVLVDINRVSGLSKFERVNGHLSMGALIRARTLEATLSLGPDYAFFADVARTVADPVVRFRATVAGSLCHNDPAGDWAAAALAARATVVLQRASGSRELAIDDFLLDGFRTALQPDEMLTEVRWPVLSGRNAGAYEKLKRKVGDWATAAVGVRLAVDDAGVCQTAGIALSAVAPMPRRAARAEAVLQGQLLSAEVIEAAAAAAAEAAEPVADLKGSVAYKRDMVRVLCTRALRRTAQTLGLGVEG